MNKKIKIITLSVLMFFMMTNQFVMKAESNVLSEEIFKTEVVQDGLAITGFDAGADLEDNYLNVQFPDTINGQKVVEIKAHAFQNDQRLQGTLQLGEHVKRIGYNAFSRANMTKIEGLNVEALEGWSLEYNDNLKEIVFPSLQEYKEGDFAGLLLDYLNIGEIESLSSNSYFAKRIKKLDAPGLISLEENALNNKSLEYISAPKLEKIGQDALANNPLKTVELPSLVSIDSYGFWGSFKIWDNGRFIANTEVELHFPNLVEISEEAFMNSGLKSLEAPKLEKIGPKAFQYADSLEKIKMDNLPEIEDVRDTFLGSGFLTTENDKIVFLPFEVQNVEKNKILDVVYIGDAVKVILVNPDESFEDDYLFIEPLKNGDPNYNFAMGKDNQGNVYYCVDVNRALYEGFYEEVSVDGNVYILEFGYHSRFHEEFAQRYAEIVEEINAQDDLTQEEKENQKHLAYNQLYEALSDYRLSEEAKEKQQKVSFEEPTSGEYLYAYDNQLLSSLIHQADAVLKESPLALEKDEHGNDDLTGPALIHLLASNEELAEIMAKEESKVLTKENFRSMIEQTSLYEMVEAVYGEETLNLILDRVEDDSYSYTDLKYYLPFDPTGVAYLNQSLVKPGEPLTSVHVKKEWVGGDDLEHPSIVVNLLKNGEKVSEVRLSEENNWQYTWTELEARDDSGDLLIYSVEEIVPDNYVSKIEGDMKSGFTIINTLETPRKPEKPVPNEPEEHEPEEPVTNDPGKPNVEKPSVPEEEEVDEVNISKLPATGLSSPLKNFSVLSLMLGFIFILMNEKEN